MRSIAVTTKQVVSDRAVVENLRDFVSRGIMSKTNIMLTLFQGSQISETLQSFLTLRPLRFSLKDRLELYTWMGRNKNWARSHQSLSLTLALSSLHLFFSPFFSFTSLSHITQFSRVVPQRYYMLFSFEINRFQLIHLICCENYLYFKYIYIY